MVLLKLNRFNLIEFNLIDLLLFAYFLGAGGCRNVFQTIQENL